MYNSCKINKPSILLRKTIIVNYLLTKIYNAHVCKYQNIIEIYHYLLLEGASFVAGKYQISYTTLGKAKLHFGIHYSKCCF